MDGSRRCTRDEVGIRWCQVPVIARGRQNCWISERDNLLVGAARFFPGCTDREVARKLHGALSIYRDGRWRRDRAEATCPPQHRGKLVQVMWMILKTKDVLVSERTIRRALSPPPIRAPMIGM